MIGSGSGRFCKVICDCLSPALHSAARVVAKALSIQTKRICDDHVASDQESGTGRAFAKGPITCLLRTTRLGLVKHVNVYGGQWPPKSRRRQPVRANEMALHRHWAICKVTSLALHNMVLTGCLEAGCRHSHHDGIGSPVGFEQSQSYLAIGDSSPLLPPNSKQPSDDWISLLSMLFV